MLFCVFSRKLKRTAHRNATCEMNRTVRVHVRAIVTISANVNDVEDALLLFDLYTFVCTFSYQLFNNV